MEEKKPGYIADYIKKFDKGEGIECKKGHKL